MNLIAFYSRTGENYLNGTIKVLTKGNTEVVAEMIKDIVGGDLFKIEQATPYSNVYNECIDEAMKDQRSNARPKLVGTVNDFDRYDTVYLGFPNYWGTMPMAVFTFLDSYDFSGKTVVPFCTHEGSGAGSSVQAIRKACPGATVKNSFSVYGHKAADAKNDLLKYLNNN